METIISCERYKLLRRWMLATRDAQGLYQRYGFKPAEPTNVMEKLNAYPYAQLRGDTAR
jgi:hypothetical protein